MSNHYPTVHHVISLSLVHFIDVKKLFLCVFSKVLKTCFFLIFFVMFLCILMSCFVVVKTKAYKITNMMHFSWAKTPFPGQSECFVEVLLTLFDSY